MVWGGGCMGARVEGFGAEVAEAGPPGVSGGTAKSAGLRFSVPRGFHREPFELALEAGKGSGEIRYTLDGSVPTPTSALYGEPLVFSGTQRLRAVAFRGGRRVCVESAGEFHRLEGVPPPPEVRIGDLQPVRSTGFGHTYGGNVRYSGNTRPPQKDRSNSGQPLKVNRRSYPTGLGVHAPCAVMYALRPEWGRFVGLAG